MKNQLILAVRLTNLAKHRFSIPDTSPYDQHHIGMDAQIQARHLKQQAVVTAITTHVKLPTLFSSFTLPRATSPRTIKLASYLFERKSRDNWIRQINQTLELGYRTTT